MKFQILILTQRSRSEFLEQLLSVLEPQIAALGIRKFDQVDIAVIRDEGLPKGWQIGDKREWARQLSGGEYICFVDSDDLVAPDYIARILPLLDGIDYLGWEQECWIDGKKDPRRDWHSLEAKGWFDTPSAFHRDINHLNPMRRELALQKSMSGDVGEDMRWADAMRPLVKTEHFIPNPPMYFYLARSHKDDAKDPQAPWRLELLERLKPR